MRLDHYELSQLLARAHVQGYSSCPRPCQPTGHRLRLHAHQMSTFITHPSLPPRTLPLLPLDFPHTSTTPVHTTTQTPLPLSTPTQNHKNKSTMRPSPCLLAALTGLAAAQNTGTNLSTSTATTTETASVPPYSTVWVVTSTTTTVAPSATLAVSPTSSMFPFFCPLPRLRCWRA